MHLTAAGLRTCSEGTTLALLPSASGVTKLQVARRERLRTEAVNPLLYAVVGSVLPPALPRTARPPIALHSYSYRRRDSNHPGLSDSNLLRSDMLSSDPQSLRHSWLWYLSQNCRTHQHENPHPFDLPTLVYDLTLLAPVLSKHRGHIAPQHSIRDIGQILGEHPLSFQHNHKAEPRLRPDQTFLCKCNDWPM